MSSENEDLFKLRCDVCRQQVTQKIVYCSAGHSYCHICLFGEQVCPLCEDILQESIPLLPCPHRALGCFKRYYFEELQAHADTCDYKPFSCIFNTAECPCSFIGKQFNLKRHIIYHHKEVCRTNFHWSGNLKLKFNPNKSRVVFLCQYQERDFIFYAVTDDDRKFKYIGLQLLGNTDPMTPITYEIELTNKTGLILHFREHCRSCREAMETPHMKSGFYPAVPVPILDLLRTSDNKVQCLIRILE